jgi:hypothetical protein
MSDAQTWTLIIGTFTVQASTLGIVLGFQWRATKALIGQLQAEIGRLTDRVEHLDRDVQRIVDRIFGEGH